VPVERVAVTTLTDVTVRTEHNPLGPWSLQVLAGECVALTGNNGVGKSTLLRLLCGRIQPASGKATLHPSRSLAPEPFHPPLGLRTHELIGHLCRCVGTVAPAAITALCTPDVMASRLDQLSRGELKRVVVAQAFIGHPTLLLLDEPLEGLDREGVALVTALVHQHIDGGGCAIIATHRSESWAHSHTRFFSVGVP
jgi:ABC-type multidrug transport system ATPase subunit